MQPDPHSPAERSARYAAYVAARTKADWRGLPMPVNRDQAAAAIQAWHRLPRTDIMQPDQQPSRRLLVAYTVAATVAIVAVLLVLGVWVVRLGLPFPMAVVAGAVAYLLLKHTAALLSVPVLGWAMHRWPHLAAQRPVRHEFAVDLNGRRLVYQIVDGPNLERLNAWCRAHGLEPERVVVPQVATIADGHLTIELYAVDVEGRKCVDPEDETRVARTTATVRLMDNPPDCWVRQEVSRNAA